MINLKGCGAAKAWCGGISERIIYLRTWDISEYIDEHVCTYVCMCLYRYVFVCKMLNFGRMDRHKVIHVFICIYIYICIIMTAFLSTHIAYIYVHDNPEMS